MGLIIKGEKAVSKERMAIFDGDRLWQKREYFSLTKSGTLQRKEASYMGVCQEDGRLKTFPKLKNCGS